MVVKLILNDLINFMKKKGIRDTFQVLTQFKDYKTDQRSFYKELNKISYYNAFFRIKYEMIKKGLIKTGRSNGKKYIWITAKGKKVYDKLVEINEMISKKK